MFSIVVATDVNLGIGKNNTLPWRLKKDMAYFKDLTIEWNSESVMEKYGISKSPYSPTFDNSIPDGVMPENNVIMGRKTWESIPERFRPLDKRFNIILSRALVCDVKNTKVSGELDAALDSLQATAKNTYVIGGAEIYRQAILHPKCERIYLTQINKEFDCDTFFPEYRDSFELISSSELYTENGVDFQFKVFGRK